MVKYAYCERRVCAIEVWDMKMRIKSMKTINLAFSIIYKYSEKCAGGALN